MRDALSYDVDSVKRGNDLKLRVLDEILDNGLPNLRRDLLLPDRSHCKSLSGTRANDGSFEGPILFVLVIPSSATGR